LLDALRLRKQDIRSQIDAKQAQIDEILHELSSRNLSAFQRHSLEAERDVALHEVGSAAEIEALMVHTCT